ncbi:MAG: gluconokinase [Paracoccus sp. (in: a-proteobacteria)]
MDQSAPPSNLTPPPRRIVVMGVSGCGKSTLARALAERLGYAMIEGGDLHPPENLAAMAAGHPLDDAMRAPWLDRIANRMEVALQESAGSIAACSALKRAYRNRLAQHGPVYFLHLALPLDAARSRMTGRQDHFMPPALAASQAALLEPLAPGEPGRTLGATRSPRQLLDMVLEGLPGA